MSRFQIELELTGENERLLLTDYTNNNNHTEGITYNENLNAEENDYFTLSFDAKSKFPNGLSIEQYLQIGRPLWLTRDNPQQSIRMVISAITPNIENVETTYSITAQDYASYVFSKNSVGLKIDTIEDDRFWEWLEEKYPSEEQETNILTIGNYILEKTWLRNNNGDGWEVVLGTDEDNRTFNLSVSDSNAYNALIEIAEITNYYMTVDYENKQIIYINKESSHYDRKNYQIQRDFNMESLSVSYNAEDLYSIYYVHGAEDENEEITLISDLVDWKDNFIYNLDYFEKAGILTSDQINDIQNKIEGSGESNLPFINEKLQKWIKERYDYLGRINERESYIKAYSESLIDEDFDSYEENYNNLEEEFKAQSSTEKTVEVTRQRNYNKLNLRKARELKNSANNYSFNIKFPLYIDIMGKGFKAVDGSTVIDVSTISMESLGIDLDNFSPTGKFTIEIGDSTDYDLKYYGFYFKITEVEQLENFKKNWINVNAAAISYKSDETDTQVEYETIYPYFTILKEFDNIDLIEEKFVKRREDLKSYQNNVLEDMVRAIELHEINSPTEEEETELEGLLASIQDYYLLIGDPVYEEEIEFLDEDKILPNITFTGTEEEEKIDELNAIIEKTNESDIIAVITTLAAEDNNELWEVHRPGADRIAYNVFSKALIDYDNDGFFTPVNDSVMARYKHYLQVKRDFWYDLKSTYGMHIFLEGYYDNATETNAESLLDQSEIHFKTHRKPKLEVSTSYIDISNIIGQNVNLIEPGDYIEINEEKVTTYDNEETKLQVVGITENLRSLGSKELTINQYDKINNLLEQIIARSNN